jgi:ribosomal protein S18 acetylase RimI-like enzyme
MREFRKAQPQDADAIAKLYAELNTLSSPGVLPDRIAEVAADTNSYLIVCDDGKDLLATALISLCNDVMFNRQPFAIVDNFVVATEYQREGIGKSLMDHIEEFCLQRDCSKIMLLSDSDNRGAHDFYTAMGFDPDAKLGFIKYRRYFGQ